jgi:hypothetical protein
VVRKFSLSKLGEADGLGAPTAPPAAGVAPLRPFRSDFVGDTAWLAQVVGHVQGAAAPGASVCDHVSLELQVDLDQVRPEAVAAAAMLAYIRTPFSVWQRRKEPSRGTSSKSSEGAFCFVPHVARSADPGRPSACVGVLTSNAAAAAGALA